MKKNLLLLICSLMTACSFEEVNIKNAILQSVKQSKGLNISIDLNDFKKDRINKICVQTPYLDKATAEKKFNARLPSYDVLDDRSFALWIFTSTKPPMQIGLHRWKEVNFGEDGLIGCAAGPHVRIFDSQLYLNKAG
jgi:hypothetical protein